MYLMFGFSYRVKTINHNFFGTDQCITQLCTTGMNNHFVLIVVRLYMQAHVVVILTSRYRGT